MNYRKIKKLGDMRQNSFELNYDEVNNRYHLEPQMVAANIKVNYSKQDIYLSELFKIYD